MKNQSVILEVRAVLIQLIDCINQLSYDDYVQKHNLLGNSSIGEHTRHIVELFQQLLEGYETGSVDYDKRKRNLEIQESVDFAVDCMAHVICSLEKTNKPLLLKTVYNKQETEIETSYYRELVFNIEHCIHHQAIIKIALLTMGKNQIDESFGVAKSTLIYRKECVQ